MIIKSHKGVLHHQNHLPCVLEAWIGVQGVNLENVHLLSCPDGCELSAVTVVIDSMVLMTH